MADERKKRLNEAQQAAILLALIIAISARRTARAMSSFRRLLREKLKAGASKSSVNRFIDQQYLARAGELADAMGVAYVKGYQRGIRTIKDKLGKAITAHDRMNQHSAERGKFELVAKAAGYSDAKTARIRAKMKREARKVLRDAAEGVKSDIAKARAKAKAEGMNLGQSVKLVNKTIRKAGTSINNPYHLETIYKTRINMEFNAGIWDASQSLIADGKVWGFEYVTMGDNKVRPEHELLEGTKLPFNHPLWDVIWPPNGWNCRCSILQVFADEPGARIKKPRTMPIIPEEFRFPPGTTFPKPNAA